MTDNIKTISYEEYYSNLKLMSKNDKDIFDSFQFKNPLELNDTEQVIATLKGMFPENYNEIVNDNGITGKAHNFSHLNK